MATVRLFVRGCNVWINGTQYNDGQTYAFSATRLEFYYCSGSYDAYITWGDYTAANVYSGGNITSYIGLIHGITSGDDLNHCIINVTGNTTMVVNNAQSGVCPVYCSCSNTVSSFRIGWSDSNYYTFYPSGVLAGNYEPIFMTRSGDMAIRDFYVVPSSSAYNKALQRYNSSATTVYPNANDPEFNTYGTWANGPNIRTSTAWYARWLYVRAYTGGGTETRYMGVNVDGTWRRATPYVNVNGTWKQATPYVNVNGTWKQADWIW